MEEHSSCLWRTLTRTMRISVLCRGNRECTDGRVVLCRQRKYLGMLEWDSCNNYICCHSSRYFNSSRFAIVTDIAIVALVPDIAMSLK